MTKLIDTIDELNRGQHLLEAAYIAVHALDLEHDELEAMTGVLGAARDAFDTVEKRLDEMNGEKAGRPDIAADG